MEIEKRKHAGYDEFERAVKKGVKIKQYFGKYQYIYTHKDIEISLVKLGDWYRGENWEIYCLKGNLFEDVERFRLKRQAVKEIEDKIKIYERSIKKNS